MSETEAIPATPLARWLAGSAAPVELATYRGRLTPRRINVTEQEMAALVSSAAVHDLGWLKRFAVRGEDRLRWLNGMITNSINDLAVNAGVWNLVLNAQGRIQGELYVWRVGDEYELEIAADQAEKLIEHLNRFIIMDDVELVPLEAMSALGLTGPMAEQILEKMSVASHLKPLASVADSSHPHLRRGYENLVPHYQLWVTEAEIPALWTSLIAAGATPVGSESLDALRIAEAIPSYGVDMVERDLPQETSQTRALHFSKGCYLGQEIVERIRSRGNVHRHLRLLEIEGPLPVRGTELVLDGLTLKSVGEITSAAELRLPTGTRRFALAMIRSEAELGNPEFLYSINETTGTAHQCATPICLTKSES